MNIGRRDLLMGAGILSLSAALAVAVSKGIEIFSEQYAAEKAAEAKAHKIDIILMGKDPSPVCKTEVREYKAPANISSRPFALGQNIAEMVYQETSKHNPVILEFYSKGNERSAAFHERLLAAAETSGANTLIVRVDAEKYNVRFRSREIPSVPYAMCCYKIQRLNHLGNYDFADKPELPTIEFMHGVIRVTAALGMESPAKPAGDRKTVEPPAPV